MTDPLVTVLMPVYNGGDLLRFSIESILSQTYKDLEFLIINDCSTDNSMETIRSYKDPRIVVHTNEINMGQTKSLNVGLKLAKGKYIVINDADDLSLPQRIEKQLDFILRHPGYVVVGASSFIMNRSGRIKRTFLKPTDSREIFLGILSDTPLIHGSVIMDRKVILEQGGYDEGFKVCQDYELWSSLIRKGLNVVANLPDILVVIRHYLDSISFKEKDVQTLENGKTIYTNINALTTLKTLAEDAIRQRLFFVAPEVLRWDDFKKAEDLFRKECRSLNGHYQFDPGYVSDYIKSKLEKPYCKLALAKIMDGQLKEARRVTFAYLKQYGFHRRTFFMFLFSCLGQKISKKMPSMYGMWQKAAAEGQLITHRGSHLKVLS